MCAPCTPRQIPRMCKPTTNLFLIPMYSCGQKLTYNCKEHHDGLDFSIISTTYFSVIDWLEHIRHCHKTKIMKFVLFIYNGSWINLMGQKYTWNEMHVLYRYIYGSAHGLERWCWTASLCSNVSQGSFMNQWWSSCFFCFLPGGNGDLGETPERRSLGQTHKRYEGFVQEVHFTHQDVGGLCVSRDFLHEFVFQLQKVEDIRIRIECMSRYTYKQERTL